MISPTPRVMMPLADQAVATLSPAVALPQPGLRWQKEETNVRGRAEVTC